MALKRPSLQAVFQTSEAAAEKLQQILEVMDRRVKALQTQYVASDCTPENWPVKRKVAASQVLEPVGEARDFMFGLLSHEDGTGSRQLLTSLFEDCDKVAHIHAILNLLSEIFAGSHLQKDQRLGQCFKACEAVEGVLRDAGLADRLAKAVEKASDEMAEVAPPATRVPSGNISTNSSPSVQPLLLFEAIDSAETTAEVLKQIDAVFDHYAATDKVECLIGEKYDACIADIMTHIHTEAEAVSEKYPGMKKLVPPDAVLRQWVIDMVDPNGDGAITRDEARIGFKAVVDDIEADQAQYEVKKRNSIPTDGSGGY